MKKKNEIAIGLIIAAAVAAGIASVVFLDTDSG